MCTAKPATMSENPRAVSPVSQAASSKNSDVQSLAVAAVGTILATGPKRGIVRQTGIEGIVLGAPFGDNMMTGTAGLILAMARKEGIFLEDD